MRYLDYPLLAYKALLACKPYSNVAAMDTLYPSGYTLYHRVICKNEISNSYEYNLLHCNHYIYNGVQYTPFCLKKQRYSP